MSSGNIGRIIFVLKHPTQEHFMGKQKNFVLTITVTVENTSSQSKMN